MIQPLRTMHRRIFVVLAMLIPAVIVAGVVFRKPESPSGRFVTLVGPRSANGFIVAQKSGKKLEMIATRQLEFPDLLVYWSSRPKSTTPDSGSILLGRFIPGRLNRFALPEGSGSGTLILYSTPLAKVIDTAEIRGTP